MTTPISYKKREAKNIHKSRRMCHTLINWFFTRPTHLKSNGKPVVYNNSNQEIVRRLVGFFSGNHFIWCREIHNINKYMFPTAIKPSSVNVLALEGGAFRVMFTFNNITPTDLTKFVTSDCYEILGFKKQGDSNHKFMVDVYPPTPDSKPVKPRIIDGRVDGECINKIIDDRYASIAGGGVEPIQPKPKEEKSKIDSVQMALVNLELEIKKITSPLDAEIAQIERDIIDLNKKLQQAKAKRSDMMLATRQLIKKHTGGL